jgi:predicted unusual protein kinase regulating ubiquinone biosynthesis (AarF/ABC1/UbiB family)
VLLDFGQTVELPSDVRHKLARLIIAINRGTKADIAKCMLDLNWRTAHNKEETLNTIARIFFDTCSLGDHFLNIIDKMKKEDKIMRQSFETAFVNRVILLMRGIFSVFEIEKSIAATWLPFAERSLQIP